MSKHVALWFRKLFNKLNPSQAEIMRSIVAHCVKNGITAESLLRYFDAEIELAHKGGL